MSKWANVRLGDIATLLNGRAYKQEELLKSGKYPVLRVGNFFSKKDWYYSDLELEDDKYCNNGDLLFAWSASFGPKIWDFGKVIYHYHIWKLILSSCVFKKYLYYYLDNIAEQVKSEGHGITMIHTTKNEMENRQIPLPPLETQRKIADNLDKVSYTIDLCSAILEKLDLLVKSRFVEMFGDPFNNNKWQRKKLNDVSISISDGSNVNKKYYQESGDVLFFRIQNVWCNEFRLDDSVYISQDVNQKYIDTSLYTGDLLITKIGRYYTKDSSLGRVSVYLGKDNLANYSNNIMRVRLKSELHSIFVNYLLNLEVYHNYIKRVSVGGTDKRALSKAIIGDFPIIVPPLNLQKQFASFVEQVDKSKTTIKQVKEKAETLKKKLMQDYFDRKDIYEF